MVHRYHPKIWLQHYRPSLVHAWGTVMKATGQSFKKYPWLFTVPGRRNGQIGNYLLIQGLWPVVGLDGQGPGSNMSRKSARRKCGEEVCEQISLNGKKYEDICVSCECSLMADLSKREF